MQAHGIHAARDGLRWHLVEARAGQYDWRSFLPMLRAARRTGVQVIWDLCHYGYPAHVDIWAADSPERFARYAAAAAALVRDESDATPFYCPVNEISFWAWAGGDVRYFAPLAQDRGMELKRQLVRASLAAMDAVWAVDRRARFVLADPAIHVLAQDPADAQAAASYCAAQYQAWDMIAGRLEPGLGGAPAYLDIVGVNFYPHNQWFLHGPTIVPGSAPYRPLREMLAEVHGRYGRPLLMTETGDEGDRRAPWLRYVCEEVGQAMRAGVPMHGICLYPVTAYPGWGDDRHCETGLFGFPGVDGQRPVHAPLAEEIAVQQRRMARQAAARAGAAGPSLQPA